MSAFIVMQQQAIVQAIALFRANKINTLLSLLVMLLVFFLPASAWVLLENVSAAAKNISGTTEISIFLKLDVSDKDIQNVQTQLTKGNYGQTRFVSKLDAFTAMSVQEGFGEVMKTLSNNPLPDAFMVEPFAALRGDQNALQKVVEEIKKMPQVAQVIVDLPWFARVNNLLNVGRLSVQLLSLIFALTLVAISFTLIRLQILGKKNEIEVAMLIGATNAFICRPFVYFGALQSGFAALLAALLMNGIGMVFQADFNALLALINPQNFTVFSAKEIMILGSTGAFLGYLGAQISLRLFLQSWR